MYKDKAINVSLLLDFYGELLPEHQREAMEWYYNDDMSLSEIAENIGISRQGVRDRIVKGEKALSDWEEKLGLIARFSLISEDIERIRQCAQSIQNEGKADLTEILSAVERIQNRL